MAKILGLDLGTNSIGWAVVEQSSQLINGERRESLSFPEEEHGKPGKGVLIFSEGVKNEKGKEKSRAAERTGFRSTRRLKFRRKLRKFETLKALIENRMCPLKIEELEIWRSSISPENGEKQSFQQYPKNKEFLNWLKTDEEIGRNPYFFRDKFSREKQDWENDEALRYELGRAFYHMAQRRGFASNRKDNGEDDQVEILRNDLFEVLEASGEISSISDLREDLDPILDNYADSQDTKVKRILKEVNKNINDKSQSLDITINKIGEILKQRKNLGPVKKGIEDLNDKINEANCETLGQYFYHLYKKDRHKIVNRIRTLYTEREGHYLHEFDTVCKKQQLPEQLVNDLKKAIFYQRPLKSQKGLVGNCSFEKNKPRCPVSHPAFEEYRMYQFINNIKIKTPNDEYLKPLEDSEKKNILPKFFRMSKPNFKFEDIADEILPKGQYAYYKSSEAKNYSYLVNYKLDTTVSGCPTMAKLMGIFGNKWEDKAIWKEKLHDSWKKKIYKNGEPITQNEVVNECWHALFFADLIGDKKDLIDKSSQDKLREFANKSTNLTDDQIKKYSSITGLKKEYASLSLNAIQKILHWLKQHLIYSHAVFMANIEKVVDEGIWEKEKNLKDIKDGIKKIIEDHQQENKIHDLINGLLKECRDNGSTYSEVAKDLYRNDVDKRLKEIYGGNSWEEFENKNEILTSTYSLFIKRLKRNMGKGEFLKIQRIDEKVMDFLRGNNEDGVEYCSDEKQLENLYHPSDMEKFQPIKKDGKYYLGSPMFPSIKNPMAMRTLHQLRKLINELLKEDVIDEKTKIHIELARELNDANKRAAIIKYQDEREKQREIYRKKIRELYYNETQKTINPTDDDVLKFSFWIEQDPKHEPPLLISEKDVEKYQYWDEQHHKCLYTGNPINIASFIGTNPTFDIEHTIPKSVSYDNSQMNKTICDIKFNRQTKSNKMPSELSNHADILILIEPWKKTIEELEGKIAIITKRTKAASTKEQKDKMIQERHYLTLHRDYWKGKYDRFTMKEIKAGFKNSQKVDTGIITKYAREFLSSVFKNKNGYSNVYAVNGQMVDVFRKAWGLHEKEVDEKGNLVLDVNGFPIYKEKDRSNHAHHCLDAITIASMTKEKYDTMAHAWGLEEKYRLQEARKTIENSKPWETFTQDVKEIENKILIVHHKKDNVPKQSKKKLKKRGMIVPKVIYDKDIHGNYILDEKGKKKISKWFYTKDKNGEKIPVKGKKLSEKEIIGLKGKDYFISRNNGEDKYHEFVRYEKTENSRIKGEIVYQKEPIYQQGDTVRGSLHQDTFYGAVKQPIKENDEILRGENNKMLLQKNQKTGKDVIHYVVRKKLSDLKDGDLKKIVDDRIREIVIDASEQEKKLKKEIEGIKKQLKSADEGREKELKAQVKTIENKIANELYIIPSKKGKNQYTPINKVRIKAKLTNPLSEFKAHRDQSKHVHKQQYHVQNEENYCMAIYECKKKDGKIDRSFELVNYLEAGEYFRLSNETHRKEYSLVPEKHEKKEYPLKAIIGKGQMVLFYDKGADEIWELSQDDIKNRLYKVVGFEGDGRIQFRHHQVAMQQSSKNKEVMTIIKYMKENHLKNSEINFNNPVPWLRLSKENFNFIVEGTNFKITPTGKIERVKK